jgi:hypothetical protein
VSPLERASKAAAVASVLAILLLTLVVHPDMTWLLRGLAVVALVAGWFVFSLPLRIARPAGHPFLWLFVAAIAPALLRLLAGREGPVLDIVWMAGLSGAMLRNVQWTRWMLPAPWNVLIGGWTLALSLAWPVLVARETGFRVGGFFDFGAINSWLLIPAPQAAVWILYVVLAQLIGAMWFEWAREKAAQLRSPILLNGLWAGATVGSVVAVLQGTIDLGLLSTPFWEERRRATGLMLDANSYGMCAALAASIGFLGMRQMVPHRPAAAIAVFAVNFAGMWLSGSRTALLCGVIGTIALAVGLARERRSNLDWLRKAALWVPAGVVAVLVIMMLTETANPIRRALDIPSGRAGLVALWDRDGYGPIALRMTRDYPLTGVGAGSYRILAPDYWRAMANDTLPLDNAQNWWRHQIAELGVFGGALVIALSVLVAWRLLTSSDAGHDVANASTVRGLLIGLGVTSFFGMSTQNPLVLLWFFALLAWFMTLVPSRSEPGPGAVRVAWIAAACLALSYAAGHLALAIGSLSVAQRAERAHREYVAGAYPAEPLPDATQFRWTGQDARFVWPAKTRWLIVRLWTHHPDVASNPVQVTLTGPCGVLFDRAFTSTDPLTVGITLPEGQQALQAALHVSRTWKPSDRGSDDERQIGAGIMADFVSDPVLVKETAQAVDLAPCGRGV